MDATTEAERFWSRVEKGLPLDCWPWTAGRAGAGRYGCVRYEGRDRVAHRVAWQLVNGPIPQGWHVLHRCDRPECVNPAHLFLGSHADNMADKVAKGRQPRGERAGNVKLKEADVREIRRLLAGGALQRVVGARFGVTQAAVSHIAHRKTWAWLGVFPSQ